MTTKRMDYIDPNIICQSCGDWHCISFYDPVCFPIRRPPESEVTQEPEVEPTQSDEGLPEVLVVFEPLPDALIVKGVVYERKAQSPESQMTK